MTELAPRRTKFLEAKFITEDFQWPTVASHIITIGIRISNSTAGDSLIAPSSKPTFIPPEVLYPILLEAVLIYIEELFLDALKNEDIDLERLSAHPLLTFLHVSYQFRETTFVVLRDTLGLQRCPDGGLLSGGWDEVKRLRKALHMARYARNKDAWSQFTDNMRLSGPLFELYFALVQFEWETRRLIRRSHWSKRRYQAAVQTCRLLFVLGLCMRSQLGAWFESRFTLHIAARYFIMSQFNSTFMADLIFEGLTLWERDVRIQEEMPEIFQELVEALVACVHYWGTQYRQYTSVVRASWASHNLQTYLRHSSVVSSDTLRSTRVIPRLQGILERRHLIQNEKLMKDAQALLDEWLPIMQSVG